MAMKMVVKRLSNLRKKLEESEEYFGVLDLKPEEIFNISKSNTCPQQITKMRCKKRIE